MGIFQGQQQVWNGAALSPQGKHVLWTAEPEMETAAALWSQAHK